MPSSLCTVPVMPPILRRCESTRDMRSWPGDVLATEIVHHDVAVTFEHRHQRLHLTEHTALLGRREQADETALVERVATGAHLVDRARHRAQHRARIGVDELERLAHEPEEVLAHPRNAGELRPVRHLVDRDPQAEVGGAEREALLERQDVGADVVDRVAAGSRRRTPSSGPSGTSRSYWPSTRCGHVAEQPAHLGGRDPPAHRRERVVREARAEASASADRAATAST